MLAGIAIKPGTKVDVLYQVLDSHDKAERPDVSYLSRLIGGSSTPNHSINLRTVD